jgi:Uma2 family endonuclease
VTSTATPAPAATLTAEQFFELPDDARWRRELVEGEVRVMSPAGFAHGAVATKVVRHLDVFVSEQGLGIVLSSETGFTIARDPDTVRAPDAAFVRADRVPPPEARAGFAELAPDLVVEVVSPNDRATDVLAKTVEWLTAGVRTVWVVDPALRTVTVHRPDGSATVMRGDGAELDGEDVLPGFRLRLSDLFA